MPKQQWTKGNFVSQCECANWLKNVKIVLDSNGIQQLFVGKGSKYYYADGLENGEPKFGVYTTTADCISNWEATSTIKVIFHLSLTSDRIGRPALQDMFLSTTSADIRSGGTYSVWWDKTNNILKETNDSGSTWHDYPYTLPFGIAQYTKDVGITSFTPFTFIGCCGNGVFINPCEIKIANGLESDGKTPKLITKINTTIKTYVETTTSDISTANVLSDLDSSDFWWNNALYFQDSPPSITTWCIWYDTLSNKYYQGDANGNFTESTQIRLANFGYQANIKRFTSFKPMSTIDELAIYY